MRKIINEIDPTGKNQHDPGAKLDHGKIRTSLLLRMGLALMAVADLLTTGAVKYSDNGWAEVENGQERYSDAALGHMLKIPFEKLDPDTKVPHSLAAVWNSLAALQLEIESDPEWKERLLNRKSTQSVEVV